MSIVQVFAGPNGSGKSTITGTIPVIGTYINADEIQRHLQCGILEAAKNAKIAREYCLENHVDFTIETILSTPLSMDFLRRAREQGYYVICHFILTRHPDINVQRVADRVAQGGQGVPEERIRSRYGCSLKNLVHLPELCDELYVFDNSTSRDVGTPALIVQCVHGKMELKPSPNWGMEMLRALMEGRDFMEYMKDEN